jgi:hypothetical protein
VTGPERTATPGELADEAARAARAVPQVTVSRLLRAAHASGHEDECCGQSPASPDPGAALRLVQARTRMQAAVVATIHMELSGEMARPGSLAVARNWQEVNAAARGLLLAQNAYDDYAAGMRERLSPGGESR